MSAGGWMMLVAIVLSIGTLGVLIFAMVRSIQTQRTAGRSIWREFGLGLILMTLFFVSWIGHGIAEWQVFTDEQAAHGESTGLGDFVAAFAQGTLENWQSEFLQLFSFVVLAALFIHKGSAESKDGEEKVEASLRRIEQRLGTLPDDTARSTEQSWQLPETPIKEEGR